MNRTLLTSFLLLFSLNYAFCLADLVVSSSAIQPSSVKKGGLITVQATAKNIGNQTAAANYMLIYMSSDKNFEFKEIIGRVAIKQLTSNSTQNIVAAYSASSVWASGNYYIGFEIDPFDEINENDEDNLFYDANTINLGSTILQDSRIPNPILFIHGYTDDSDTWNSLSNKIDSLYGWIYGGRLNYCLNPDNNQYTSDGFVNSFVSKSDLIKADYYYLNFDVSTNGKEFPTGSQDAKSNQSAITKQGFAVSNAISNILSVTGAENVILVGHSMGGLASREYLQNNNLWQLDGKHHVAKLLTIATPHEGSNVSGAILGGILFGKDEQSEAARDLRYPNLFFSGLYLFGGKESSATSYYNDDVNCNGTVGDNIIGLNSKTTPIINYSCIIATDENVVDDDREDINDILFSKPPLKNPIADRYFVKSSHDKVHKNKNLSLIMRGLDEPYDYDLSYNIPLNTLWFGIVGEQADNNPLPAPDNTIDYDDYKISLTQKGTLKLDVFNIPVQDFTAYIVDKSFNVIKQLKSNGESNLSLSTQLNAGEYFIEFGAVPTPNSYAFQYAFQTTFTPTSGLVAGFSANNQQGCVPLNVNFTDNSQGSASSFSWSFPGGTPATSTSKNPFVTYSNVGVFPVTLTIKNSSDNSTSTKNAFINTQSSPKPDFVAINLTKDTVKFVNKTNTFGQVTTYTWNFGDTKTSNEVAPLHKYPNKGSYSVKLTAQNTCGSIGKTSTINVVTASNDLEVLSNISLFPNPNNGKFTIKFESDIIDVFQVGLINSLGEVVFKDTFSKESQIYQQDLDLQDLPSGNYNLVVSNNNTKIIKKISIIK